MRNDLANCVNFFPITCVYKYKGKITEEPEMVLIVKTKDGYYEKVKGGEEIWKGLWSDSEESNKLDKTVILK